MCSTRLSLRLSASLPELSAHTTAHAMPDVFDENDFYDHDRVTEMLGDARDALGRASDGENIIVIDDFLPHRLATALRDELQRVPDASWERAEVDYEEVAHDFDATMDSEAVNQFTRVAFALQRAAAAGSGAGEFNELYPSFTAAKYTSGDRIDPHDDVAFVPVAIADGGFEVHARAYAGVYYLTPDDWDTSKDGGALEDLESTSGRIIEPKFNRFVCFKVPRSHAVREVTSGKVRRSIFGWWYRSAHEDEVPDDYFDDEDGDEEDDEEGEDGDEDEREPPEDDAPSKRRKS